MHGGKEMLTKCLLKHPEGKESFGSHIHNGRMLCAYGLMKGNFETPGLQGAPSTCHNQESW
jgi:hypothetical protein